MPKRWFLLLPLVTAIGCGGDNDNRPVSNSAARLDVNRNRPATGSAQPGEITSTPLSSPADRPANSPLFESLPSERTGVDFQLALPDIEEHVREVIHLNVNGGICTGDYDGDGLTDFYVTSPKSGNRLYRNLGDFRFQDVTEEVELSDRWFWGTGATFVDIDNDGDLDLYVCGYRTANRLFINEQSADGKVRFQEQARQYGLNFHGASMTMAFADFDNDGDLDGYLATTAIAPPPGVQFKVRFEGSKPVVIDPLREYWELIYLPGDRAFRTEAGQFDHLYRNDGEYFTEINEQAGIEGAHFSLSATWWDYNEDGFPDLYVANDFFGPDRLYHNNGDGTFTDVAKDVLPHTPWFSMGTDQADINNDGMVDFLATDMSARTHQREQVMRGNFSKTDWFLEIAKPRQYVRNALYLNSGAGRMIEAAYQVSMASTDWTWNPRLADFDNDGRVDVFITNGITRDMMNADLGAYADAHFPAASAEWARFWAQQPMRKEANVALKNLGDLRFEDVGQAWGLDRTGVSFGAATADFDNDGDLDLVVVNADAPLSVYRNTSGEGHRIRIRLQGRESNRFALGAKIDLVAGPLRQTRYLTLASGWLSANEPIASFGLGEATKIEELTVTWPSGHRQTFTDLAVDRFYTITEPSQRPAARPSAMPPGEMEERPSAMAMFRKDETFSEIEHRGKPFDDFAVQPLLPHRLSQLGPAMAWADVDGNGLDDVYVGGSKGQAGRLLLNVRGGSFSQSPVAAFEQDRDSEDTGAVFFDANGDGHVDLYVVSGSVEDEAGGAAYRDRLYFNDGSGGFKKAADGVLPDLRDSGSVAQACDFDQDGDVDLFVGSRCIPGQYPLPPANRLLVNTGGRFQDETPDAIRQAGMVTGAVWADIDGDGWIDLVVTTDWGPVRIFGNEKGQFREKTADAALANRLGWWKAVAAGDFDEDGDADFVVTNIGLNTKYRASAESPELLYYGDFDDSGRAHLVEARYEGSSLYPRRDLAALSSAMPVLMAGFDTFDKFARAPLSEIFTQERLDKAKRFEVNTLESCLLINEGQFRFRCEALPPVAQLAPSLGLDVADLNGDGHLDIVLAQNFYSPQTTTGRMDGGVSLLLLGTGRGRFEPVWPNRSGIVVPGEARQVKAVDLDGDGRRDLVFAVQNGRWQSFHNRFIPPTTKSGE